MSAAIEKRIEALEASHSMRPDLCYPADGAVGPTGSHGTDVRQGDATYPPGRQHSTERQTVSEPPEICSAVAQAAFEAKARCMGLIADNPWIGGYLTYEWSHLRHIVQALPVSLPGLRVMEVGCNVGASSILLSHLGAQVTAIDVDADVVGLARLNALRYGQAELDLRYVPDTRKLPFDEAEFDLVICNSVLEYVKQEDRLAVQRDIGRVVQIGGLILVTGSSNRLWPFEVHSGRWGFNYVPRYVDRWRNEPVERGIWPWEARYGFGSNFVNLDDGHADNFFRRSRTVMGMSNAKLAWLCGISRMLRIGPGMLAQSVSCLLQKRA